MKTKPYWSIITPFLLLLPWCLDAQNAQQRERIRSHTNIAALEEMAEKANQRYQEAVQQRSAQTPMIIKDSQGNPGYWSGIDVKGLPIYDYDDNDRAALSSRVDRIWEGGSSGLNLTGEGIIIGHWEAGGLPLLGHQEFGGRVQHLDNEAVTSHGTHTAGTMIARGERNAAHGMATHANLVARRSNNDFVEMTEFAANGGLMSNHSYSKGNPDGDILRYGLYNQLASDWDGLFYNAPYYIACKSAGNNRNDGVNVTDEGFDLMYTVATCKNLITVGAVQDVLGYNGPNSVNQANFNNWGPTDDWRIKPDITANGVSLESSDNGSINDYGIKSGTSMSTPVVTGSIALLQQHYEALHGDFMRAATVKALLISTTLEAGIADGPDFISGWGLLNSEKAAEVITNNGGSSYIDELKINNGETIEIEVQFEDTDLLSTTIVWTDPAGDPNSSIVVDLDKIGLVNDLDFRLRASDGTVHEPWTFVRNTNGDNFSDPASKGDNFRDNMERIDVENLEGGSYTLEITHKGNLIDGGQNFSIIINSGLSIPVATQNLASEQTALRLYPNPVQEGTLLVERMESSNQDTWQLRLYDLQGRLLKEDLMENSIHRLDLGGQSPGVYWLWVEAGEERRLEKVIIE